MICKQRPELLRAACCGVSQKPQGRQRKQLSSARHLNVPQERLEARRGEPGAPGFLNIRSYFQIRSNNWHCHPGLVSSQTSPKVQEVLWHIWWPWVALTVIRFLRDGAWGLGTVGCDLCSSASMFP
jgi:hypothetical protein